MLNLASMRALALGLACATFVVSPVAHAATTATHRWTDLSLSVTDADGHVTFNNGFGTTGESLWQNSLILGHTTSDIGNYDIFDTAPQPTLQNTSLAHDLGVANAQVTLNVPASGLAAITTQLNALPGVPLFGAGQWGSFTVVGGFAPAFYKSYLQATDDSVTQTPVLGGLWLAAGSTATLSGTSTATISLDAADLDAIGEPALTEVSAIGVINLVLIPNGTVIGDEPSNGQSAEGTNTTVRHTTGLANSGLLQDTQTSFVTDSITNTSSEGQWLIFSSVGIIDVIRGSAPLVTPPTPGGNLIPEPGTYALMGLGLVGVALAARRQRPRARAR